MPTSGAASAAEWPRHTAEHASDHGGTWPHALSHEPLLRVSDVLNAIAPEFPALSPSKLRFLDTQGLVVPRRTGGGYRHYSPADVERVRFVLRQQRDHYRPLTVIASELAALDRGETKQSVVPVVVAEPLDTWLSLSAFAATAGVTPKTVELLTAEGVLAQERGGLYSRDHLAVVRAIGAFFSHGGDVRAVRSLALAASHQADRGDALDATLLAKGERERAKQASLARAEAAIEVFAESLRRRLM